MINMGIFVTELEDAGFGVYSSVDDAFVRPFKKYAQEIFSEHVAYLLFFLLKEKKFKEHTVDDDEFDSFFNSLPKDISDLLEDEQYALLDLDDAEMAGKWLYEMWPEYSTKKAYEALQTIGCDETSGLTKEEMLRRGGEISQEAARRGIRVAEKGVRTGISVAKKSPEYLKQITPAIRTKKILIKSEIIEKNGKKVRKDYYKTVVVPGTVGIDISHPMSYWDTVAKVYVPTGLEDILTGEEIFFRVVMGGTELEFNTKAVGPTAVYKPLFRIKTNRVRDLSEQLKRFVWTISKATGGMETKGMVGLK